MRALLASVPETVSVPPPPTAMEPEVTVALTAVIVVSTSSAPAPVLLKVVAVIVPPLRVTAPAALLTVKPSATTPSGRTVIAAAELITALSPA